jgi:hypothetical protein
MPAGNNTKKITRKRSIELIPENKDEARKQRLYWASTKETIVRGITKDDYSIIMYQITPRMILRNTNPITLQKYRIILTTPGEGSKLIQLFATLEHDAVNLHNLVISKNHQAELFLKPLIEFINTFFKDQKIYYIETQSDDASIKDLLTDNGIDLQDQEIEDPHPLLVKKQAKNEDQKN